MFEIVTLEIPTTLMQQAKEIAQLTDRLLEAVLIEWLDRASTNLSIETMPDEQVLALCDSELSTDQQTALSDLLERNREGQLHATETQQLNELMQIYRRDLVRKARALKVAISRGLRPPLKA
jgi:hypothetical protein